MHDDCSPSICVCVVYIRLPSLNSPQEPQTFFTSKQYCYCNIWRRRRRKSLLASNFRLIHILCFISIAKWLLSIFFNCKFFCNVINSRLEFKFILKVTDSIRSYKNKIFGLHTVLFFGLPTNWRFYSTKNCSYSHELTHFARWQSNLSNTLFRSRSHFANGTLSASETSGCFNHLYSYTPSLNISDDMSRLYITRSFCILFKREPNYFVFL